METLSHHSLSGASDQVDPPSNHTAAVATACGPDLPALAEVIRSTRQRRSNQPSRGPADTASAGMARVLIVDDETVSRKIIRRCLESHNCEVAEAADASEALTLIRKQLPDLVLLDFQMPRFNGLQTLRMIRLMHSMNELAVVMMTAGDGRREMIEALENGANDFVSKPVDQQVILARIRAQMMLTGAQKALRESEERYALAARGANDGLWDWNLETGALHLSPRWLEMLGIEKGTTILQGGEWMSLIHPEDATRVYLELESHLLGDTSHFETELRMQHSSQGYRWMLCRGLAVRNAQGLASRIAGSLADITDGKVADSLTSLPNRNLFHDRIARCLETYRRRPGYSFAVLFLDVDGFKEINDNFGHEVGDEFLVMMARRLESLLSQTDAVAARLGGDEFGILVENVQDIRQLRPLIDRILDKIRTPVGLAGREILVGASLGVAFAHSELANPEEMLREADTAMYVAKKTGGQGFRVFHASMIEEQSRRFELLSELRHAMRRDELQLHYQPIINSEDCSTAGFEVLLRWLHPVHGRIPPVRFIPLAESSGMIVEIGRWVLESACREAAHWQTVRPGTVVSVNVSVRQLTSGTFVNSVVDALQASGLPPKLLKLEVTESMLMQNADEITELLRQLRTAGVTIGIDDFGTGYSSLACLHQMPLDVLKIDRSFVMSMMESEKNMAIVRTIIALAGSLRLETIAEGVETSTQAQILETLGCHLLQGFLFSPAVPAAEARDMLNRRWETASQPPAATP